MKYVLGKHRLICFAAAAVISFFMFSAAAQTAPAAGTEKKQSDEITLPDVTTVISGDALTAGKNAVPDFDEILPEKDSVTSPLPDLPVSGTEPEIPAAGTALQSVPEKSVYAEGLVGGGYPGFFTGDFSVYRTEGENPFRLDFSHESMNGYARESSSNGFFDSTTSLGGNKKLTVGNSQWNFTGSYKTADNGLQDNSDCFYDMTRQTVAGTADMYVPLENGFDLNVRLLSDWYKRYAGVSGSGIFAAWQKGTSIFSCIPSADVSWNYKNFTAGISGEFSYETNAGESDWVEGYEGNLTDDNVNRGEFSLSAGWKNDIITVSGRAGLLTGSAIGDNSILVPFTVNFSTTLPTSLSVRPLVIKTEGGMDSSLTTVEELENTYSFTALSFLPAETSDWYGKFGMNIPLKDLFTLKTNLEYRRTADGNGIWVPDYDSSDSTGIYGYSRTSRTLFDSEAGFSVSYRIFTFTADWTTHWMYVPVTEGRHMIGTSVSVAKPDAKYGADADIKFNLGNDVDSVPIVNLSAYYRLASSLRLEVRTTDIVKLLTGEPRTGDGSYIYRSGNAAVLVKFFF
jgi:hypothetical protein